MEVTSFSFWCHCHLHISFVLEAWRAATATCLQQVIPWIFPHRRDGVTLGLWCELFKTWRAYTLVCRYLKVSWNPVLVQYIRSKRFAKYGPLPPALKAFQRHVSIYCLFRGQQEREDLITSFMKKKINVALHILWSDFTKVQPTIGKTKILFSEQTWFSQPCLPVFAQLSDVKLIGKSSCSSVV